MPSAALAERRTRPVSGIDTGFPLGCPVEVQFVDQGIVDFCEMFIPGFLDDPASFRDRIYIPNRAQTGWLRVSTLLAKIARSVRVDPFRFIRAHVDAGRSQEPQTVVGIPWTIPAIGILFNERDRVDYTNLDLDGSKEGPAPHEVIEFLRTLGLNFMVTRGSGKEGRFRVLMRHDRAYSVDELHERWKAIFYASNRWEVKDGSIEVFPWTKNGRLPLGFNACVLFDPDDLGFPEPILFGNMLATFQGLEPSDLDELRAKYAANPLEFVDARKLEQDTDKTNHVEHEPLDEKPGKSKGKPRELRAEERADVERFRREGIRPDERLDAYRLLIKDDVCRGLTREECNERMKEWIREGGIARSNHFRKRYKSRYIAAALVDIPRHVERLYAVYEKCTSPAVDLSVRDVLNLAQHVERVAAQLGITVKRVGAFALDAFPRWKGYPDAIRTDRGILTHWTIWKKAAGNKSDYDAIRDAFGFFRPTSGYLPQTRAVNGKGHARTWACDFPFDESSPGRALGRTWKKALDTAKARQDKPSCKTPRKSAKTKQRCAKKPRESK